MDVSVPCDKCSKPIRLGDDFCEACGEKVDGTLKDALRQRLEGSDSEAAEAAKHIKSARQAIVALAVLFVLGGVVMFVMAQSTAEKALHNLDGLDADMVFPQAIDGVTYKVGELREMIEAEPYQILVLNLFLAAVMAGLWVWAKRAVLPAVVTALAVYVAVQVGNVVMDPKTIVQGIFVKVIAIIVLVRGVRSALAARAIERRYSQARG